jgi:ATP-dependent DNA ligase
MHSEPKQNQSVSEKQFRSVSEKQFRLLWGISMTHEFKPQLFGPPIDDKQMAKLIASPDWGLSQKADGRRVIVHVEGSKVWAISRGDHPAKLPANVIKTLSQLGSSVVLDGELFTVKKALVIFDLLAMDGQDLREESFWNRQLLLETLMPPAKFDVYSPVSPLPVIWDPKMKKVAVEIFHKQGAEGVVFKHKNARYVAGRPAATAEWYRRKWTVNCTVEVTRQDPTKKAVFYRYRDTGEIGSITMYSNKPMAAPNQLLSVKYLYADPVSKALVQPIYQYIRKDVTEADSVTSLQFKEAARGASA